MLAPFSLIEEIEIRHFHFFCGIGGGALGFNRGRAQVGNRRGKFRCIGGIDVDAGAIRDFTRRVGVPGTVLDLFDRDQYRDFHGCAPPAFWKEATLEDIRRAAGYEYPHIVFLSAPCKGFSGLLSEKLSKTAKYQALNRLTLRGIWLMLEAFADHLPELVLFENVPRIATRGRALLDQITALLRSYGYAVAETNHDCGELGGLAQSRRRFLMVARRVDAVPPFLYQPPKRPLRAVGDILQRMPLPGDPRGGPMHLMPNLQWKTWVRLAFVEAGGDWRSLNRLAVKDGYLADYLIIPATLWEGNGRLGITRWDEPAGTIQGASRPENGKFSVADPRQEVYWQSDGVNSWNPSNTAGRSFPNNREFSVADPRFDQSFRGQQYGVRKWEEPTGVVTSQRSPGQGSFAIADRRCPKTYYRNAFRIVRREEACFNSGLDSGPFGVVPWREPGQPVDASGYDDNDLFGASGPKLPSLTEKLVAVIRSLDGSWHRPFTTLELAALQSLVDPYELFPDLDGNSDSRKREAIGNAVPPNAAQAIADTMGTTLLLAMSGQTFTLSSQSIWVQPVAVALSVNNHLSS